MAVPGSDNKGPCFWCFKTLKWIPVLFIVTIVAWSYYAYVIQLCLITIQEVARKVIYLIFYHMFFFMFCLSYWQTIFTDVGRVPSKYKIPDADYEAYLEHNDTYETQNAILENLARRLPITNVTVSGGVRFCEKCRLIKPDRAHHCSVCGVCVLKMDHHCPWINNCVSFTNYKFFVLFLGYALAYCLYISLTSLPYFISFWRGDLQGMGRFHILFLFFVAIMFGVSLLSLFGYHCYLVCENRTTLEAFRPPSFRGVGTDKYGFHVGRYRNFQEVFGDDPKTWFLPVSTSLGDGIEFPVHSRHQQNTYHSMDNMQNRYLDDDALLSAVRSNRSWLTYAKGDPVLKQRLTTALLEERERFLKMKTQDIIQRPLPVSGTFLSNNQKIVVRKPDNYFRNKELYKEILEKPKTKKMTGKVKTVKNNLRNKPYRL